MKLVDTQLHICKLEIEMIENGNISSNHLNIRGLHLNEGVSQFTKDEGIWKL